MLNPRDHQYESGVEEHPERDKHLQSSVPGLYVIGAAAGSPLLKTCINEGVAVVRSFARTMPPELTPGGELELLIVGAGPAGIAAALAARKRGYRFLVLEQSRPFHTVLNFPNRKHVYAEPATLPVTGELAFEDSTKEELLEQWGAQAAGLDIVRGASVERIVRRDGKFEARTTAGDEYTAKRVIVAIGRLGNPRRLGVPGEDLPRVYSVLLNPGKYRGRDLVVVGGGNAAVEAALALAPANRVTIVHRRDGFHRVSRANRLRLEKAERDGELRILLNATVKEFRPDAAVVTAPDGEEAVKLDAAFVLIGADPPTSFLKRHGVKFEGEWRWSRLHQIAWVFALIYSLYAIKTGRWPFANVFDRLAAAGADPNLLYGILYSGLLSAFGLRALRKYREDPYQRRRYQTLITAQWLVYFLLPWGLYFAGHSDWWRSWGVTLTYPLGYYGLFEPASTLFAGTALPWAVATLAGFLIVMPLLSIFHGKRFCSWFCPCGGMADTVGDAWRHKAPRGTPVRKWESVSTLVLILTVLVSVVLIADFRAFVAPESVKNTYKLVVDFALASVIAITLYPFAGPRIWCRFACPLAKWMELWGRWSGGKLAIVPNEECISCGECTRYCQMGIDVRAFAQREETLSNSTTTCIFCGICVTVCPVDVLSVRRLDGAEERRS